MTVDVGKHTILFQSGDSVFDFNPDPSLLGITYFFGTGKYGVISGAFVRNDGTQCGEILPDSLISRIAVESRMLGNELRENGLFEDTVIMPSARTRAADMKDVSVFGSRNLRFNREPLLFARMVLLPLQFLERTGNRLFGTVGEDIAKLNAFWKKFCQLFEGFNFLSTLLFSRIRNDESVLQKEYCLSDCARNRTLVNAKQIFEKRVGRIGSCPDQR